MVIFYHNHREITNTLDPSLTWNSLIWLGCRPVSPGDPHYFPSSGSKSLHNLVLGKTIKKIILWGLGRCINCCPLWTGLRASLIYGYKQEYEEDGLTPCTFSRRTVVSPSRSCGPLQPWLLTRFTVQGMGCLPCWAGLKSHQNVTGYPHKSHATTIPVITFCPRGQDC